MKVAFIESHGIAEHIRMFWFKPEKPVRYTAGQFIELRLPHKNADERGQKRWFTLASSPTEPLLAITTKRTPEVGSSFKRALWRLKPGSQVDMSEPMGDFVLPKDPSIPLVFVAGGIGITPMRSMVQWLHDTQERRDIKLLYAVGKHNELAFQTLFQQYGCSMIVRAGDDQPPSARLTAKTILAEVQPSTQAHIYLSGPEPMIETLVKQFETLGDTHQLVTDYFPGYLPI
jgi:ferredoxin-NADP reductase